MRQIPGYTIFELFFQPVKQAIHFPFASDYKKRYELSSKVFLDIEHQFSHLRIADPADLKPGDSPCWRHDRYVEIVAVLRVRYLAGMERFQEGISYSSLG